MEQINWYKHISVTSIFFPGPQGMFEARMQCISAFSLSVPRADRNLSIRSASTQICGEKIIVLGSLWGPSSANLYSFAIVSHMA